MEEREDIGHLCLFLVFVVAVVFFLCSFFYTITLHILLLVVLVFVFFGSSSIHFTLLGTTTEHYNYRCGIYMKQSVPMLTAFLSYSQ